MNLQGKTALVTGGAAGIGYATTLRLLREGCAVAIYDIDEQALSTAEESVRAAVFFRGVLPDSVFQGLVRFLGVHQSMSTWRGKEHEPAK